MTTCEPAGKASASADAHLFRAKLERHASDLPVYLIVPPQVATALGRRRTFVAEVLLDGCPLGRRSIKPWGDGRWFMELTKRQCSRLQVDVGACVRVEVRAAPDVPPELMARITALRLSARWGRLSETERRAASEAVFGARRPTTRNARIERTVAMLQRMPGDDGLPSAGGRGRDRVQSRSAR